VYESLATNKKDFSNGKSDPSLESTPKKRNQ